MDDLKVPLNMLKFGHEDGEGINARVTGRDDGIAELAANIFANRKAANPTGLIENLIVKPTEVEGVYSVANGNRRLKALHMIDGADSDLPIPCTPHEVDETTAFEYSLTTAITAAQLHPVDQYEAFARLEEHGKTREEIAQQYGMAEKQVRQALALGRLSPKIRGAWRAGDIKAEIAQAFTLALDHETQDRKFAELQKSHALTMHNVKRELGAYETAEDVTQLLDVVGDEAYVNAGGRVTRDLFGHSHIVSNPGLLQQMARHIMIAECERLSDAGWGWAEMLANLPHAALHWPISEVKTRVYEGDEEERLEACRTRLAAIEAMDEDEIDDATEDEQLRLNHEIRSIENAIRLRSYPDKKRRTLGCIVHIEEGRLVTRAGVKRPAEAEQPPEADEPGDEAAKPASSRKPAAAPAQASEPEISGALLHRLSLQLTNAAATSLIQDEKLAMCVLLAGFDCFGSTGVRVSVAGLGMRHAAGKLLGANDMTRGLALAIQLKPDDRISLLAQVAAGALDFQNASLDDKAHGGAIAICNAIEPKVLNAALRGAFDAKDYFSSVSGKLCLAAISEALGADLARQQAQKSKADIAAFALENVPTTGWLPPQLRARGYDGPPVKQVAAKLAPSAARRKPAKAKAAAKTPAKRAAVAKKSAKKTSKKKR
jgi:ParB family chromosome partitioning protein